MRFWFRAIILLTCLAILLSACRPVASPLAGKAGPTPVTPTRKADKWIIPSHSPRPAQTPFQPTEQPTLTPLAGRLVFSSWRQDTNGDGVINDQDACNLYIMDLTTGAVEQLTFGEYVDITPNWSPDGEHVAFASNRGGKGNYDLFVVRIDGTGLKQLTDTPQDELQPAWSPDGKYIAYIRKDLSPQTGVRRRLFLISTDGTEVRQVSTGPGDDGDPDWSPDGRFLAFRRKESEGNGQIYSYIYLYRPETGSLIRLELPRESPAIDFDYPRWLPRRGNFLSVIRFEVLGDILDSRIVVYKVREQAGEITVNPTPADIELLGIYNYTWGSEGEWLIGTVQPQGKAYGAYDLLRVRVSLAGPSSACWCTDAADAKFLTEDDYPDDYPDWAP